MKDFIKVVVLGNLRYALRNILAQVFYADGQTSRHYFYPLSDSEKRYLSNCAKWREGMKRHLFASSAPLSEFKRLYYHE